MSNSSRRDSLSVLRWLAATLFILSVATCVIGPRYDASRIPSAHRATMSDVDWIGTRWIVASFILAAIAVVCLVVASVQAYKRRQTLGPSA